jgi:hypothetical protein
MTKMITRNMSKEDVTDAYSNRVHLGDRALDLNSGCVCVVLDHIPELGPESLYVQLVDHEGPAMSYWVAPDQLVKLERNAA